MWGRETFAMAVSSSSMNVASVTVMAISHGLTSLVRSVLVERTAVAAAIFASCSTQMADETERSHIINRVLVERTAVAAAIFASCSTQMADETERSHIINRSIGVLVAPKGDENASWLETALAGTPDCSDSVRRNQGIDGLVSVSRRGTRFPVFAP